MMDKRNIFVEFFCYLDISKKVIYTVSNMKFALFAHIFMFVICQSIPSMKQRKISVTYSLAFVSLALLVGWFNSTETAVADEICADQSVIITQIYGGGGNSGAPYTNDFIELYNPTEGDIVLDGWSIQYASANSSTFSVTTMSGTIGAGKYFLIQQKAGAGNFEALPDPDAVGTINLATGSGRVALVESLEKIQSEVDVSVRDLVVYDGGSNTKGVYREANVCPKVLRTDTPSPRNSDFAEVDVDDESSDGDAGQEDTENDDTDANDDIDANDDNSDTNVDESDVCSVSSEKIRLNEIFPYPQTSDQEYVELQNFGESCVDISGWRIEDAGKHSFIFPQGTLVASGAFFVSTRNFYLNNTSTEKLCFFDGDGGERDCVSYDNAEKEKSLSFSGSVWQWTSARTPGEENVFEHAEENDEEISTIDMSTYRLRINEIFPNPIGDEKTTEYIELYNDEDFSVSLENWVLKDVSKTQFLFDDDFVIAPKGYLTVYRNTFAFALNNSGVESVYLLDPDGNIVSSATYENSKEDVSFVFDGKIWRWSKFLTPGEENTLSKPPKIEVKKEKVGYVGIPVSFEVSIKTKKKSKNDAVVKYRWNFGNKRTSSLQNPHHVFQKAGKYTVSVVVNDGSEEISQSFPITIKKYPKAKMEIVAFLPNPSGGDVGNEWIELRNTSEKKVNLKGWKIATGSSVAIHHAIADDVVLEPNATMRMTREHALFTLNNTVGVVEVRYPDGTVASRIEYEKEKIAEGELCQNVRGQCAWSMSVNDEEVDDVVQEQRCIVLGVQDESTSAGDAEGEEVKPVTQDDGNSPKNESAHEEIFRSNDRDDDVHRVEVSGVVFDQASGSNEMFQSLSMKATSLLGKVWNWNVWN